MSDETERNLKFKIGRSEAEFFEKSSEIDQKFSEIFENPKEARAHFEKMVQKKGREAALKAVERNPRFVGKTKGTILTAKGREEKRAAAKSQKEVRESVDKTIEAHKVRAKQGEALDKYRDFMKRGKGRETGRGGR